MLARNDFAAIAGKASLLRGRVVRFAAEGYNELGEEERQDLAVARDQLKVVLEIGATSKASDKHIAGQIQLGIGEANEALNKVFAIHRQESKGE